MLFTRRPIRFFVTRLARAYGFFDPIHLLGRLRGFSEASEVAEPIELLRAGMLFHARGLVNTKAIQNNLDWVWPYWVERQFSPNDVSFIPRAFSFSHINLTHRNWTAVGLPDVPFYPIVDPRGLVTPLFDGWSLDFWLIPAAGSSQEALFPSKAGVTFTQALDLDPTLRVRSLAERGGSSLASEVALVLEGDHPACRIRLAPGGTATGHVAVALRPYNPEGISFVETIESDPDARGWLVNGRHAVTFDQTPSRTVLSVYREGDAVHRFDPGDTGQDHQSVRCPVGLATAVALFPVEHLRREPLIISCLLANELAPRRDLTVRARPSSWADTLAPLARLRHPDARVQMLYDRAVANLVLHCPGDIYPGPYTYKRFWFRDAAFMLHALLAVGDIDRARRALHAFAPRQRRDGYFLSQQGEWDSNGEAIWIYERFAELTGETLPEAWLRAIAKGARWISRKRLPATPARPEAGLLPAGFSAEHLGPNDYYYWDDFWGVAGLQAAARLLRTRDPELAVACEREAAEFLATIERSFPTGPARRFPGSIPAAPKRRMDSGAVGSLVADYPLQLFPPGDRRILLTADYLRDHSSHSGGFFQNMIHSGINPYLTLHLAQVRLRAGDAAEAWRLMDTVATLASPTGQWPEAIHPNTGGGCMGDGQHIWAASEWVLLVRACFVREEPDGLVLGSGLRQEWLDVPGGVSFGPTLTRHGTLTIHATRSEGRACFQLDARWRGAPPLIHLSPPGFIPSRTENAAPNALLSVSPAP